MTFCFAFRPIGSILLASILLYGCQLLTSSEGAVTGRIADSSGAGVSGVKVSLQGSDVVAESDGQGRYRLERVPVGTNSLQATKAGWTVVPRFSLLHSSGGGSLSVSGSSTSGADFVAFTAGEVTIPLIQGNGEKSPLEGTRVDGVRGVVTMVTRKAAHSLYETLQYDGSSTPQWISEDGFFLEAFGAEKDGDSGTSDGIFVDTHDSAYEESKWKVGFPTDLKEGEVVYVSGVVRERRPEDRFHNSASYLTRTVLEASAVVPAVTASGTRVTTPYPDGVVLTFDSASAGSAEYRVLPWQDEGPGALSRAIRLLESVEGMVVRVNNPAVVGSTYYNLTGVFADGGQKTVANGDFHPTWRGLVLGEQDFNTELLFADYQRPTWTTFNPIPQVGDRLLDSTGAAVLRGVMDYTVDPVYMIRPLQHSGSLTGVSGASVPPQGWGFDSTTTWYPSAIQSAMKNLSTANRSTIAAWRMGSSADAAFRVPWVSPESDRLTVAAFNLENYINQGKPYAKDVDVAKIIVGNLKSPDVIVVVEMGDDNDTSAVYENQADSYVYTDGVVTSVANFRGVIAQITAQGGPSYDFRVIDPQEGLDGGAPGNNIRVGFLFRTDRIRFLDRGLATNTWATTSGASSTWPVVAPGPRADQLATLSTGVFRGTDGLPHLTQSPGRLQDSSFRSSRKPLVGEFAFLPTGQPFFVVGLHLSSKGGDQPLYGTNQPPRLGSEAGRKAQATVVRDFVRQILAVDPLARVVVAGDLNDFGWSTPIRTMTGAFAGDPILFSPSEQFMPETERFSYGYRGNLQQIDHIYVSKAFHSSVLAEGKTDWKKVVFIPHIDSVFSKNNHIQTSDHDPIAVRLGGL